MHWGAAGTAKAQSASTRTPGNTSGHNGPMDPDLLDDALRGGDVDGLLRLVDGACEHREWDALERLRSRCALAHETGHQLWPVASRAAYRLALEAPGPWAGSVLVDGAGRFAPGPLTEVAAQGHAWDDLGPHIPAGPHAVLAAHERVVRGEDLSDQGIDGPPVLELPLRLAAWEPEYALATYRPDAADFPPPPAAGAGTFAAATLPDRSERAAHDSSNDGPNDDVVAALRDAARVWADGSTGEVAAVTVAGGALDAIAALGTGPRRDTAASTIRWARLEPADAVAHLDWAGASGGAHAPRPGAAAGRFAAWWTLGALGGLLDEWPPDPDALGDCAAAMDWCTWQDPSTPATGWRLNLAVVDARRGRAWAVRAHDVATPEDATPEDATT